MKKSAVSVLVIAGLLSVLLSGCRTGGGPDGGMPGNGQESAASTEGSSKAEESTKGKGVQTGNSDTEKESEADNEISGLPYQFVKEYGIIKSESPVYELDTVIESQIPQKEIAVSLTFAICQKQELIVDIVFDDYSEVAKIPAGGEPPADGMYYTLKDGSMIDAKRYQDELWMSGEGLYLTGPGIQEAGIKPLESMYGSYTAYFEAYGNKRYIIGARFEIPPALEHENNLTGYKIRILDFEEPLEFDLKRASEYDTLDELLAEEHGSMDTHDGISIISMGEKVKEGILVDWYVYSEAGDRPVGIAYKTPLKEQNWPVISSEGKQYPIKQLPANPYWDTAGTYRLSDVKLLGRRFRYMFDVPQEERNGAFQVFIPGITLLNSEESPQVTLSIPEDYEELNEDIPWKEGSVRILGITRMKENDAGEDNVRQRPAVYIDVAAVHEDKNLELTGLLCSRKTKGGGWERERYDFDEKGRLSGFRILYDKGEQSVTLKFHGAAFYWNQPYMMELPQLK